MNKKQNEKGKYKVWKFPLYIPQRLQAIAVFFSYKHIITCYYYAREGRKHNFLLSPFLLGIRTSQKKTGKYGFHKRKVPIYKKLSALFLLAVGENNEYKNVEG